MVASPVTVVQSFVHYKREADPAQMVKKTDAMSMVPKCSLDYDGVEE
jgi:hypothetical protein